jgi:hypothetical protein
MANLIHPKRTSDDSVGRVGTIGPPLLPCPIAVRFPGLLHQHLLATSPTTTTHATATVYELQDLFHILTLQIGIGYKGPPAHTRAEA